MLQWRRKRWFRVSATLLGTVLVAAAVAFAWQRINLSALRQASPWLIVALLAAVVAHVAATSLLFHVVTLSFDAQPRVSYRRNFELIAASSLLNYLPLYAGLIGRAAYLNLRHRLPLRQAALIVGIVVGLSALVALGTVTIVALAPALAWGWVGAAALLIASALIGPIARRALGRPLVSAWAWAPLRMIETIAGAARLGIVFTALGEEISISKLIVLSAASMLVTVLSPFPNGLGLREWTLALLSGPAGAAASVLDRAAEAIVFTALGLFAVRSLRRDVVTTSSADSDP